MIYNEDCLERLDKIPENSIDSIVTDPPYELNFMNKGWDNAGISFNKETWKKCLRVLKPGGYLLAFGGSRTYHRIACAIEDAGFEIRDTIMWLYGSGFPKSMNIGLAIDKKNGVEVKSSYIPNDKNNVYGNKFGGGKTDNTLKANNKWQGWGTALKPSFEPIIVARKPFKGSLIDNVIEYGVGGINIDECRVGTEERTYKGCSKSNVGFIGGSFENGSKEDIEYTAKGRFPANTILTYDQITFDEVCGGFPYTKSTGGKGEATANTAMFFGKGNNGKLRANAGGLGDSGSASRYFYCAKASKKDRDEGLEGFKVESTGSLQGGRIEGSAGSIMLNSDGTTRINPYAGAGSPKKNIHPTVKPTELMQYLVRLVTPKGGIILDPFMGSGSTGKAVMYENNERQANYQFIGIEKEKEYCDIAKARIEYVINKEE